MATEEVSLCEKDVRRAKEAVALAKVLVDESSRLSHSTGLVDQNTRRIVWMMATIAATNILSEETRN